MSNVNLVSKGYQSLPVDTDTNLGTLATLTAVSLDSTYGSGMTRTFLLKYFKYLLILESLTTTEGPVIIGLAKGSATAAEIASAFVNDSPDPDDATSLTIVAARQAVFWQSVQILDGRTDTVNSAKVQMGARGKGIPIIEDDGIQLFAFNADISSLTTGARVRGMYFLEGVWLND